MDLNQTSANGKLIPLQGWSITVLIIPWFQAQGTVTEVHCYPCKYTIKSFEGGFGVAKNENLISFKRYFVESEYMLEYKEICNYTSKSNYR